VRKRESPCGKSKEIEGKKAALMGRKEI